MNKKNKNEIIELGDILEFNYRLKLADDSNAKEIKFETPLTIKIGDDELFNGLDERLIGESTVNKKIIVDNFQLPKEHRLLPDKLVHIGIKVLKHEKNGEFIDNSKEGNENKTIEKDLNTTTKELKTKKDQTKTIDALKTKELDLSKKIKELESENKLLIAKNDKLKHDLETNLNAFKTKQEAINKKAQEEVIRIRQEIKEKAKTEIAENKKYILQKFTTEILNPLDTLYRTVSFGSNQNNAALSAYAKGFSLITNQIFQILNDYGVEVIEPKEGEEFNAEFHEVHDLIDDSRFKKDQIVKVLSRGYKLHGRVLRPAKVDVNK